MSGRWRWVVGRVIIGSESDVFGEQDGGNGNGGLGRTEGRNERRYWISTYRHRYDGWHQRRERQKDDDSLDKLKYTAERMTDSSLFLDRPRRSF